MKISQAKEYLPLVQAAAEGKTIQWKSMCGEWIDCNDQWPTIDGDRDFSRFRIKPEPNLRPWKPEEVPVGALYRGKDWMKTERAIITHSGSNWLHVGIIEKDLTVQYAFESGEHSTDGGKTWKPCGVEE